MTEDQKLELIVFLQDDRAAINQFMDETGYANLIYIRDEIDKILEELENKP